MSAAGGVVHEEGLVRGNLFGIGDHGDGPVGQVLAQVIALFGGIWLVDKLVVLHQIRVPLIRLGAQEAVVAVEPRPVGQVRFEAAILNSSGGCQMPFPEGVGIPAFFLEHFGNRRRFERDVTVAAPGKPEAISVMPAMPTVVWLRPVNVEARVGEQSAVVWNWV